MLAMLLMAICLTALATAFFLWARMSDRSDEEAADDAADAVDGEEARAPTGNDKPEVKSDG
jgi:nitrogen fixation-related uncharacterized protein